MDYRPYSEIHDLLASIGGSMTYRPGGGPGGVWELGLRGRHTVVSVRDNRVNALDRLYVAKVADPVTWNDYSENSELASDAFWKLVALFND